VAVGRTPDLDAITHRAQRTRRGFTDLKALAEQIVADESAQESLRIAKQLLASDVYQARMVAAFICGMLAAQSNAALRLLRTRVSHDASWQVQEILAQAFDRYCADSGYERALPIIKSWLSDTNPNVRRAASEGLRIWTSRPFFKDHPETAIRLLRQLKDDESEYVRRSAGNALRDISRKYPALIRAELRTWDNSDVAIAQTHKLAGRFVLPPVRRARKRNKLGHQRRQ
jgi:3-methyladenine DNA glycosylase AlkC